MVENRPWTTAFCYLVLTLGVLIVAFPLYVTFVASTLTLDQILNVPMSLVPGDQFLNNYSQVLSAGSTRGASAPVGRMMINSGIMALIIAFGKIGISIVSALNFVYLKRMK